MVSFGFWCFSALNPAQSQLRGGTKLHQEDTEKGTRAGKRWVILVSSKGSSPVNLGVMVPRHNSSQQCRNLLGFHGQYLCFPPGLTK